MKKTPYRKLLISSLSISSLGAMAQQDKPNIIFIMSDDHSAEAISCYDGSLNNTPNLDSLAEKGVRFTNCFCTNGISGPSRATILTGTFNHINGQYDNSTAFDTSQLNMSKVFRANGYQTAIIGKWHLKTTPSGFDYWNILPGQGAYYNPDFIDNGERKRIDGYVTDIITDNTLDWLSERDKEKPFFMMVHHKAPHRNWLPRLDQIEKYWNTEFELPESYHFDYNSNDILRTQEMSIERDMMLAYDLKILHPDSTESLEARYMGLSRMKQEEKEKWMSLYKKRYESYLKVKDDSLQFAKIKYQWYMQDYLACIDAVDQSIGEIMQYLKKEGLDNNTIVIYTSDQGFFLGQKGWFDKRFMYEESLRMPLIISDPTIKDKGTTREQMVMNVDFAPTFLEMAGIETPKEMQGRSFVKQINNKEAQGRESVYYHYFEYPGPHSVLRHYGVRTKKHKLIRFYHDVEHWEMYDLEKDPNEMNSVFENPDYSDIREQLMTLLKQNRTEFNDTIESAPSNTTYIKNDIKVKSQTLKYQPHRRFLKSVDTILYDCKIENTSKLGSKGYGAWLGMYGDDLDVTWELEKKQKINSISIRVLDAPGSWIFPTTDIKIFIDDEEIISSIESAEIKKLPRNAGGNILVYTLPIKKKGSKIRIYSKNLGMCPDDHPGRGNKAWLFIDEIIVK